jgi:erythromycin esterase-like protein
MYTSLDDWIRDEAIPFSPESFNTSVDKMIASLGDSMEILGFGEGLHGGDDILLFRNRLFQRLVEAHGYSAIAIESSFPRGRIVNEYVLGHGPEAYEAIWETGFSHGFGHLEANRELVEWMRQYNADDSHNTKIRFYGFDSPMEMTGTDSPRQLLHFVLDYLDSIDQNSDQERRERINSLLGSDADWENPDAMMDPTQSVGLSAEATALRIETENLIIELHIRQPELVAKSDRGQYWEALKYAAVARQLLGYHAAMARQSDQRITEGLGIRDMMMADILSYIAFRERGRGKVLAFAHNSHLKRGQAHMQLGPGFYTWWPAGAHLHELFGSRYAIIGSGVGVSEANGIGMPEPGTLEARLTAMSGAMVFIPTLKGQGLPASELDSLPTRSGSAKNPSYFPFTHESFTDFDGLVVFHSTTYTRSRPLPPSKK